MISQNSTFRTSARLLCAAILLSLFVSSCKDDDSSSPADEKLVKNQDATVPQAWMGLYMELDRYALGFRPGPSPRALAYINMAAYEAAMDGMPEFKSLKDLYGDLDLPTANKDDLHYPTVLNAVYATLTKRFIPSNILLSDQQSNLQFKILELENRFNEEFRSKVGGKVFERSQKHGEAVANAFWEWSTTDVFGHEAYLDPRPASYTPPTGPGLWQPTAPDFGAAMFPYWGEVRSFAISEDDKLCKEPDPFSEDPNSLFYDQAEEVKIMVGYVVDSSNTQVGYEEKWIAEFWSDDFPGLMMSPPARWISITHQVIELEGANLETALYAYAKVSIALNDASVATWHSKYVYNVERPVSYIRRVINPDWTNHWNSTPAFPAYPSGHSVFGAAAAEALSHVFGYNYAMTDRTHEGRSEFLGTPRSFVSFYAMAEENAYSRIPLGVHFRMDAEEGVELGYRIGRKVNEMPFKK